MAGERELPAAAKVLQAVAKPVFRILTTVVPLTITTVRKGYHLFLKLPQNAMLFTYGSVFCFFGGTFPTLFAALQAAEHGGRKKVLQALGDLSDEALAIINESKKDDDADKDGDGKSDVKDMSSSQFMAHKTKLVLRKMDPEKVDKAISSLYTVWLSVAAVLSIKFARTISMALSIADFLKKPCDRFISPTISKAIPDDYDKWVPIVISWIIKSIAMSVAWYIQVRPEVVLLLSCYLMCLSYASADIFLPFQLNIPTIIQSIMSAFTSALAGGLMMAQAVYGFCVYHNMKFLPADHADSNLDEILSYLFAGLGFYFQFMNKFSLPAPLNLILWPFQVAEYYIRWSITKNME